MKAMIFRVKENAVVEEIENTLESLQKIVDGYIEVVPLSADLILVCDEEAKLKGKIINSFVKSFNRADCVFDINGDYFICRRDREDFCSIDDNDIEPILKNTKRILWEKRILWS